MSLTWYSHINGGHYHKLLLLLILTKYYF